VKKILIIFLVLILVVILVVVLGLAYIGFVPGLSGLMGSTKPRNLGIKYSQADYEAYNQKTNTQTTITQTASVSGETLNFSEPKEMQVTMSEAEVSARIGHSPWKYMPLTNFQIRFPGKDIVEFSANLATDRLSGFIAEAGGVDISQADIEKGLSYLKIVSKNPPVYAKAQVSVNDNKAEIVLQKLELGRMPIPFGSIDIDTSLENAVNDIMDKTPGFKAKSVRFGDGKMTFEGSAPTKIEVLGGN
jgi:hypothetical protein